MCQHRALQEGHWMLQRTCQPDSSEEFSLVQEPHQWPSSWRSDKETAGPQAGRSKWNPEKWKQSSFHVSFMISCRAGTYLQFAEYVKCFYQAVLQGHSERQGQPALLPLVEHIYAGVLTVLGIYPGGGAFFLPDEQQQVVPLCRCLKIYLGGNKKSWMKA